MTLRSMRLIDRQFLETPFYGVRQMAWHIENEGHPVDVKRVRRLMGLMPIYQKPNTSKPDKGRGRTLDGRASASHRPWRKDPRHGLLEHHRPN